MLLLLMMMMMKLERSCRLARFLVDSHAVVKGENNLRLATTCRGGRRFYLTSPTGRR
jgi:hypothetical protein